MTNDVIKALETCFDKSPEEAVKYMESQSIAITWDWREALAKIKEHSFTVSKVATADELQYIHDELTSALKEGTTYSDFVDSVEDKLTAHGYQIQKVNETPYKWDTIFRTNLQTAYQQGRFWQSEQVSDRYPLREFSNIDDDATCDECNQMGGKICRHDDKLYLNFQTPLHHKCRCTWLTVIDIVDKSDISKKSDFPNLQPHEGFGLNPLTQTWQPDMSKYSPDIKKALQKDLK